LSTSPGTPYGPAALWFGVRRRASWKMVGVIWSINIVTEEVGVGWTWPSHGNGAPGGSVGSGDRAFVSNFSSCVITSVGVVSRRPDVSSRRTERSVGRVGLSGAPSEMRRMDLRAKLGFFTNTRRSALPYFRRRRLRAWRMRRRVAFLSPLKQSSVACMIVGSVGVVSVRRRTPRESLSLRGGLRTMRRDSGLLTLDHSGREGSAESVSCGVHLYTFVSWLMRLRMDLAWRRMLETS